MSAGIREYLYALPLFAELSKRELRRIAAHARCVRAPAGTVLFRSGERCPGIYGVVRGQVKLAFAGDEGAEKIVGIFHAGETFCEPLVLLDEPHMGYAETLSDSLLVVVGKAAMLTTLDRNGRFARRMLAGLADRLHRTTADLAAQTLKSSSQRVASYLLREVPVNARAALDVELPVPKGVVASCLSITREQFSRVLHELAHAGLIGVNGRVIHIADPERLRARAG